MKTELIKCLEAAAGLMLFAVGVYLIIQSDLGAAPWDVLCLGIAGRTGMLYGNVSFLISVIIILIDVLVLRETIGLGTVLDAIVVGKTVDLLNLIGLLPKLECSVLIRIAVLLLAFLLEALGQYLYMRQGLAFGPRDTLQIGLGKRFPELSIGWVNTGLLAVVFAVGWLLGGPVGLASLIAPFGIGTAQNLVFAWRKFDPKTVVNENIFDSLRQMGSTEKAQKGDRDP